MIAILVVKPHASTVLALSQYFFEDMLRTAPNIFPKKTAITLLFIACNIHRIHVFCPRISRLGLGAQLRVHISSPSFVYLDANSAPTRACGD